MKILVVPLTNANSMLVAMNSHAEKQRAYDFEKIKDWARCDKNFVIAQRLNCNNEVAFGGFLKLLEAGLGYSVFQPMESDSYPNIVSASEAEVAYMTHLLLRELSSKDKDEELEVVFMSNSPAVLVLSSLLKAKCPEAFVSVMAPEEHLYDEIYENDDLVDEVFDITKLDLFR
tara:strand:- start:79480 stop:79998 length:519 start_codon:yes stop_codon:yes gene_type:complete